MIISPLIVGGLINDLGIGEADAGTLITVELLVTGIVAFVVAPLTVRIDHGWLAIVGALLMLF